MPPALSTPAVPRRRGALLAIAGAVLVAGVAGLVFALGGEEPAPPLAAPPPASEVPSQVTVVVHTQPAAESKIEIDGREITGRPARAQLPRGDAPVNIVVTAEGYQPARLGVVPDRDHSLVVPLTKQESAPSAPASRPRTSC